MQTLMAWLNEHSWHLALAVYHNPALNRPCLRAWTQLTYFLSLSTSSVFPSHFAMSRIFYLAQCPKHQGDVNNFRGTVVWTVCWLVEWSRATRRLQRGVVSLVGHAYLLHLAHNTEKNRKNEVPIPCAKDTQSRWAAPLLQKAPGCSEHIFDHYYQYYDFYFYFGVQFWPLDSWSDWLLNWSIGVRSSVDGRIGFQLIYWLTGRCAGVTLCFSSPTGIIMGSTNTSNVVFWRLNFSSPSDAKGDTSITGNPLSLCQLQTELRLLQSSQCSSSFLGATPKDIFLFREQPLAFAFTHPFIALQTSTDGVVFHNVKSGTAIVHRSKFPVCGVAVSEAMLVLWGAEQTVTFDVTSGAVKEIRAFSRDFISLDLYGSNLLVLKDYGISFLSAHVRRTFLTCNFFSKKNPILISSTSKECHSAWLLDSKHVSISTSFFSCIDSLIESIRYQLHLTALLSKQYKRCNQWINGWATFQYLSRTLRIKQASILTQL